MTIVSFMYEIYLQVPSYVLMDIPHGDKSTLKSLSLVPLGEACFRMDLTAIHEILEDLGYKDDEGTDNEVCMFELGFLVI